MVCAPPTHGGTFLAAMELCEHTAVSRRCAAARRTLPRHATPLPAGIFNLWYTLPTLLPLLLPATRTRARHARTHCLRTYPLLLLLPFAASFTGRRRKHIDILGQTGARLCPLASHHCLCMGQTAFLFHTLPLAMVKGHDLPSSPPCAADTFYMDACHCLRQHTAAAHER